MTPPRHLFSDRPSDAEARALAERVRRFLDERKGARAVEGAGA